MAHVGTLHKPYIPGIQLPIGPKCLSYALFIKPPPIGNSPAAVGPNQACQETPAERESNGTRTCKGHGD